ncbi:MAG: DNA polymerase III subunit delta [Candidatus Staskawiczbacteria bacterium RIFOXYD2_FULL_37_9]|uniref:DNA polymerase III subunit delta n=1 Tax=Candidatus Staskawiczbacteria bacterium RIFOXYB1_FULL_37_44 TaxID=1802223 RepID=A0A1G2IVU4_9BACT|nr:MAG: DNA polymerase III subunit delta [Candidatus Staskawiczbacteria bacterium RIFOXYB1_FULL_37_44]OGZ83965.1 MAG: DNA polymerase III subunit delta [Candidatus Staskawiczbacteria bacterium RIFOXYC1_FULL_37_52]OGZ87962.1 MAG: DNA polymerase III subunit delta [Candidatus Staskawiczbacteria bacterium RIFOXYC2_FULL_37_19]OGZ89535.1 MAG: DNA polymerase III subunit delta [Candidatus Staskawiczbacteria bacterium RIFOXYD1_FULL_37_110]OGZ93309.1 MAG: DNA polymerase III subunit delta [Candidatus Stask
MIIFLYGEDSYRSKRKLEEIILGYKKVHKSGLNLIYINAKEASFKDFYSNFRVSSMFAEKKLIVLNNVFSNVKFQEEFLENIKGLENLKDIIVIYEDCPADQRAKFFKTLLKCATCQEFGCLKPANLKKWIVAEFSKTETKIDSFAMDLLANCVKTDLWRMANEINKLANYRAGGAVKKEDVEQLVAPGIENDIFKTIDALASKNKKLALSLLHEHLDGGDNTLYLLSMIAYQFKNLLIIKELIDKKNQYQIIVKKSGLHPFVAQKTYSLCGQFSMPELKKIYRKIFQIDLDIKTGKVEPETALDLFVYEFC